MTTTMMRASSSISRLGPSLIAALISTSCFFSARPIYIEDEKKAVEIAIQQLHDRMNSETYDAIYDDMHGDFKATTDKPTIVASMKNTRERMGRILTVKEHWLNYVKGDPVPVRGIYNLKCEKGDFTEFFSYAMDRSGKPLLVQYQNFPGSSPPPGAETK